MIEEIASLFTAIKTATDIGKSIKNSIASPKDSELKLKIADLIDKLLEAKMNISEIQDMILEKDTKIKELEEQLKIKGNLKFENGVYWLYNNDNEKDGPFCPQCYDNSGKLIRLQNYKNDAIFGDHWYCLTCKQYYDQK